METTNKTQFTQLDIERFIDENTLTKKDMIKVLKSDASNIMEKYYFHPLYDVFIPKIGKFYKPANFDIDIYNFIYNQSI